MIQIHQRETIQGLLAALGLMHRDLDDVHYKLLSQALTHTSANQEANHEELEFLGDAVLRLTCAEFLEENNPKLSVGERSAFRAQLVSDRWLAELAAELELDGLILQGISHCSRHHRRATVRAECLQPWWVLSIWLGAEPMAGFMPYASGLTRTGSAAT